MAARTGEQFLRGLAGRRDLWVGGDRVSSVVDHPALSGAVRALAEVFDLQHRHADAGHHHREREPEAGQEQHRREGADQLQPLLRHHAHDDQSDEPEDDVALEVVGRVAGPAQQ